MAQSTAKPVNLWEHFKEISRFFQGRDQVHKSLRRLVKRLEMAKIPYVVVGGMAVNAHGYGRTTDDVDILLTSQGFIEFRKRFVPKYYEPVAGRSRRFTDKVNQITLDVLVTGMYPGRGDPSPISFPDPNEIGQPMEFGSQAVRFLDLASLIQLKLAALRYQDFADVVILIRENNLDESFQEKLNPAVHRDFIECLEQKRREDEYEEGQAQQE